MEYASRADSRVRSSERPLRADLPLAPRAVLRLRSADGSPPPVANHRLRRQFPLRVKRVPAPALAERIAPHLLGWNICSSKHQPSLLKHYEDQDKDQPLAASTNCGSSIR